MAGENMSRSKFVFYIFICVTSLIQNINSKDCNVHNITVQPDFDLQKYCGTWYEVKWLETVYIQPSQHYEDYRHIYTYSGSGENVTVDIAWRDPANINKCVYNTARLIEKDGDAKICFVTAKERFSYWVLKTDYTSYAVVYGCHSVTSDGACNGTRSWIWSRTKTLSQDKMAIAETVISERLCVNQSLYLSTRHNNECPPEIVSAANTDSVSRRWLLLCLVFVLVGLPAL
ncbi:retinol-binding protein 4-like [Gigantopelta aegis]|uniref:retinol-binding protein 4-like n=1 Tax=Gigantopelta aegis TaxID=1735272 RepID=UPI001B8878E3|nr:retinol-binding protein 4-like [Gigantopelta aegis]